MSDDFESQPLIEAKQQKLITGNLIVAVSMAVLGSFTFGWNIGVVNNPKDIIRNCELNPDTTLPNCIPMSDLEWGVVVSIFAIGGLLGGLLGGRLCKSLGRKKVLMYNCVVIIIAGALMALSVDVVTLAIGRFLVGFGSGVVTAASPMYISEIAPLKYRGSLGTFHQLSVVVAILISQVLGLWLSTVPGWRFLMAGTIVPAVLQLVLMPFCIETPQYLISVGMQDEALIALEAVRGTAVVGVEYDLMVESQSSVENTENLSVYQLFTRRSLRKALIIALTAQLAQQLSGINGVMMFSSSIFESIFPGKEKLITVMVGGVNLLSTLLALVLMDVAGRRVLLLTSQVGMTLLSVLVVIASVYQINYLIVVAVALFVAVFAIGLGPIPWLIMPEIFPTYAVASATSISVMTNWTANFAVALLFEIMLKQLGAYTFLPFASISAVFAFIEFVLLPETKGRSVEDIAKVLQ